MENSLGPDDLVISNGHARKRIKSRSMCQVFVNRLRQFMPFWRQRFVLVRKVQLRKIQQGHDEICLTSQYFGAGMDPFGDDDIAQLLRLKRYEQPPG
jgi:hypothetical protein